MITANEIRIGNFYHRKHSKGWTMIQIDEEMMGKIFSNSLEFALQDFEPVILNPEILEQYQFIERDDDGEYFHEAENLFGLQNNYVEENGYSHIWDGAYTGIVLQHLHHLQCLFFFLTGKELA